jgi:hypothetical protein
VKSQPISVETAAMLPRPEQESLIRFLAGRGGWPGGRKNWSGAFADLDCAIRRPDEKE